MAQLAKYHRRRPDRISEQEAQQYLLHLIQERKLACLSCNVAAREEIEALLQKTIRAAWTSTPSSAWWATGRSARRCATSERCPHCHRGTLRLIAKVTPPSSAPYTGFGDSSAGFPSPHCGSRRIPIA